MGQGGHTMPRRHLALARAWGRCGALVAPLREGISPADFSLPESFSLSRVFRLAAAAEYFSGRSLVLRVLERMKYAKGCWQKWATVASPCLGAA